MVQTILKGLVDPAWEQMQKAAETVGTKIEPVIRKGIQPIFQLKETLKEKIKGRPTYKKCAILN